MPTIDVRNSGIHGSVVRIIDLHMSQGESVVYIVLPSSSQCPCSRRSRRGSWKCSPLYVLPGKRPELKRASVSPFEVILCLVLELCIK